MINSGLRAIVLYDNGCGFCRWSLRWVRAWDRRGVLQFLPIQSTTGQSLLEEVPEQRWLESWHLSYPDGSVLSAGRAIAPLLRSLPHGRYLARFCELFPWLTDRGYTLVASHRTQLGKLVRRFGNVPPRFPTD